MLKEEKNPMKIKIYVVFSVIHYESLKFPHGEGQRLDPILVRGAHRGKDEAPRVRAAMWLRAIRGSRCALIASLSLS